MVYIKKIWQFFLLGLSGWSFWVLYFSYYVIIKFITYIGGSACNLGIVKGSFCKYPITAEGFWAGVTQLDSVLVYNVFLLLLFLLIIVKNLLSKTSVTADYFDTAFKVYCSVLVLDFQASVLFIYLNWFFLFFFIFRQALNAFEKKRHRLHVIIIKNDKQLISVYIIFLFLKVVDTYGVGVVWKSLYAIDQRSHVDCCINETVIGGYKFQIKNTNLPMCAFERKRQQAEICKIEKPVHFSLYHKSKHVETYLPY